MFELSACIEWLFAEGDASFAERVHRAAAAGLPCVEFWTWRDKDLSAIGAAIAKSGTHLTSFVSEPEGRLVDPRTHDDFLAGVAQSSAVAESLGCRSLIVLAGDTLVGVSERDQRRAVVAALSAAAPLAARHNVTLVLEPLNTVVDHVGYFLDSTREGLAIIEDVAQPNVKLLYDIYHSAVMGERTEDVLDGRLDLVGHIHVADAPGRHEPGTGRIAWAPILDWLGRCGYSGKLGLEYMPSSATSESLSFIRKLA